MEIPMRSLALCASSTRDIVLDRREKGTAGDSGIKGPTSFSMLMFSKSLEKGQVITKTVPLQMQGQFWKRRKLDRERPTNRRTQGEIFSPEDHDIAKSFHVDELTGYRLN
ncbi:hypothetical protein EVAR_82143_1 [Eumeta japonica]|uniref:Uncharacterized protein n=1 Tax=Eumeta variegata TaxID=151549 RepID=A0A4C1U1W0_EUMVA|nr:hypothetical protein EVAR_82143_1 [Eumeta japonica]